MKCEEIQELISEYFDGELSDETQSKIDEHLGNCVDCAHELAKIENLSKLSNVLKNYVSSDHTWNQIEQSLEYQSKNNKEHSTIIRSTQHRSRIISTSILVALSAVILVFIGFGWLYYNSYVTQSENHQFTATFGHYLEEFRRNAEDAQQILLSNYENHSVTPDEAINLVGYRPAIADGLPNEFMLKSTHVIKMPCCTCVQSICKRSDGSTLAIFEHDDEETSEWFGNKPEITVSCNDKQCCLVELDDQIAASWKRDKRFITLIGVRDVAEVSQMVDWFDQSNSGLH